MSRPVVVFRTRSAGEASVVRTLLQGYGIRAEETPRGWSAAEEVRLLVGEEEATRAEDVIATHRRARGGAARGEPSAPVAALEARLAYTFRDPSLLERALTHRSRAHEEPDRGTGHNESMEFLGDAVLGFVAAEALYRHLPAADEGQKSMLKASLVSTSALARLARCLDLGAYLRLGRGEEKTGGRHKPALLADTCEAVIAAMYLDGGLDAVRAFILREIGRDIDAARSSGGHARAIGDFKSALQEHLQSTGKPLPDYRVAAASGPDHDKRFEVEVSVDGQVIARRSGRSKKEAEQQAARAALDELGA